MNEPFSDDFLKGFFEKSVNQTIDPLDESELIQSIREINERYLNGKEIDEGGMKKIKAYEDSLSGRTIAIASMKDCKKASDIDNFIREARLTAMLEHPNIVPLYDLNLDKDGLPYFSMKLLGGENLKSVISKLNSAETSYLEKFSLRDRLEIFLKITDAISYAHSKGIVHLDLKPANIHLNEFGEVLVCDWGLARELDTAGNCETLELDSSELHKPSVQISLDKKLKGTPGYMAPEQINPALGKRTEQTDIFSLGALLYALLTFQEAFDNDTIDDVLKNTLTGNFPLPKEVDSSLPSALNAIILKSMAPDPDNRYDDVSSLSRDIRSWLGGYATQAENANFFQQILLVFKRHKMASLYSLLFLVFSSLLILFSFDKIKEEKNAAQKAELAEKRSRQVAENSQQDLQKTLNDLKIESAKRQSISIKASANLYKTAIQALKQNQFTRSMALINDALALNSQHHEALLARGLLHLGNLRFTDANTDLQSYPKPHDIAPLINLSTHYSQFTAGNTKLNLEQISALFVDIKKIDPKHTQKLKSMIIKIITQSYSLGFRVQFARYHIFSQSSLNKNFNWQQQGETYALDISSNPSLQDIAVLENLPITELNLSRSKVRDISFLKRLPLEKLNLSFTHVTELSPMRSIPLKEINLKGSHVTKLSGLNFTALEIIHLNNLILNLSSLLKAPQLREVHLPKNYPLTPHLEELSTRVKIVHP